MEPTPQRQALCEEVRQFLSSRQQNLKGEVPDRSLWLYVRRYLTNYDELRSALKAKVGECELYENVKVYLCCQIIREYGLELDPLYAAFGDLGV